MTDDPKNIRKNIQAPPTKSQESVGAPRQMNGSQDVAPLGTNASGTPVNAKPKKN